ncbi:hypothetical protein AURDEDRAFT_122395 [Auricularia subglabra TFB-10046 SS5]|nr:hypothetical protein AURDEDRAFT_122395 [Auricularia subglabra TFB-10046 SS5]
MARYVAVNLASVGPESCTSSELETNPVFCPKRCTCSLPLLLPVSTQAERCLAMGRPPKYKSDEERQEARKRARRDYYNRPQSRADDAPDLRDVLPHTVKSFGLPLKVGASSDLKQFAVCLEADLRAWHDGQPEHDAWDDLTARIIAADGRRRQHKSLRKEMGLKRLVAIQVQAYAEEGQAAASERFDYRNDARLDADAASLQLKYDRDSLIWNRL